MSFNNKLDIANLTNSEIYTIRVTRPVIFVNTSFFIQSKQILLYR